MSEVDLYARRAPVQHDRSRRSECRRDRDRVLYSDAFRRLAGVTQVAVGHPTAGLHNRLTHSLKVEQVGLSIFSSLRQDSRAINAEAGAIAAACLAHDIGHPPFGHAGEQELNKILVCDDHLNSPRDYDHRVNDPCAKCELEDGFEGNAQSFRVLTVLAIHRNSVESAIGLNLTRRSLQAVSKYPWTKGQNPAKLEKWGAYDCDADTLRWTSNTLFSELSLDAEIMDWADDISYAVHDIEDFFRVGAIPIDDYKAGSERLQEFVDYIQSPTALGVVQPDVLEALANVLEFFPRARFSGRAADIGTLDALRGRLLDQFIEATSVDASGHLSRQPVQDRLNAVLKQFMWFHIIDDPKLANIQAGQRRVVRDIYNALHPVALEAYGTGKIKPGEKEVRRLPHALRRAIEVGILQDSPEYKLRARITRGLVDYIAGLSDSEAYYVHSVLRGRESAGVLI